MTRRKTMRQRVGMGIVFATLAGLAGTLAGCATMQRVEPDTAGVELSHTSHVTQHPPFAELEGRHPTNFGYDVLGGYARWSDGPVWFQVNEGYSLLSGWQTIPGPREIFQAQLGLTLWRKKR